MTTSVAKPSYFDREDVEAHVFGESMVTRVFDAPEQLGGIDLVSHLAGRLTTRVLLDQGSAGFSLIESDVAPGTRVPRHKHNLAQVVFIVEGSMQHGSRTLGPGAGYYTPADRPYTLVAGPEGCRYIEFRQGGMSDITTKIVETDPDRVRHAL